MRLAYHEDHVNGLPRVGSLAAEATHPRPPIAAARELITAGDTPRVEEVAAAAGISRPTAYRDFASQGELLAAAYPETAATSVFPDPPPAALDERAPAVAGFAINRVQESEPQQRGRCASRRGRHRTSGRCARAASTVVRRGARAHGRVDRRRERAPACVGTPRRMWHRDPRLVQRCRRTRARRSQCAPGTDGRRPRQWALEKPPMRQALALIPADPEVRRADRRRSDSPRRRPARGGEARHRNPPGAVTAKSRHVRVPAPSPGGHASRIGGEASTSATGSADSSICRSVLCKSARKGV